MAVFARILGAFCPADSVLCTLGWIFSFVCTSHSQHTKGSDRNVNFEASRVGTECSVWLVSQVIHSLSLSVSLSIVLSPVANVSLSSFYNEGQIELNHGVSTPPWGETLRPTHTRTHKQNSDRKPSTWVVMLTPWDSRSLCWISLKTRTGHFEILLIIATLYASTNGLNAATVTLAKIHHGNKSIWQNFIVSALTTHVRLLVIFYRW